MAIYDPTQNENDSYSLEDWKRDQLQEMMDEERADRNFESDENPE